MKYKLMYLYPLILLAYSVYSFSQTAPNLVLSSNQMYWQFQQFMWQLGYHNRPLSTSLYGLLILSLFVVYFFMLRLVSAKKIKLRQVVVIFSLSIAALLPSYPALSNDVFNYLMNAKMMHVYQASPYVHAAWDFPDEPWLKFMMNVHTTTPYGYIWTGLGYLIYWMTLGDLQFGMLGFRALAIAATVGVSWGIWIVSKRNLLSLAMFCLNPLVLLEGAGNTHNDITMMAFFMIGLAFYTIYQKSNRVKAFAYLVILWTTSVYTKLITVIAPGVYLGSVLLKKFIGIKINIYDLLSLALTVVMYTDGAKRFFSWYLLWALPVAALAKNRVIRILLIGFSFGGMLSYIPYLYTGEYTQYLGYIRYGFFFVPGIVSAAVYFIITAVKKRKYETE